MIGVKNRGSFQDATVEDEFEWMATKIHEFLLVEHNEDGTHRTPDATLATVPLGGCIPYTGPAASVPRGWVLADGGQLNRVTYKSYFDLVGTTYGVGDGSLTFNVPDMRQRFPLGKAASGTGAVLGATGGAIDHDHAFGAHTHDISSVGDHDHGGGTSSGGSHTHAYSGTTDDANAVATDLNTGNVNRTSLHSHTYSGTTSSDGSHNHGITASGGHDHGGATGSSSAGTSGTANPPFLALNYIIYVGR